MTVSIYFGLHIDIMKILVNRYEKSFNFLKNRNICYKRWRHSSYTFTKILTKMLTYAVNSSINPGKYFTNKTKVFLGKRSTVSVRYVKFFEFTT